MEQERQFTVSQKETGSRLDVCLAGRFPEFTRSYLQKLCKDSAVLVDDAEKKSNYKVREGERVILKVPKPTELSIKPEKMDLDIVYEDRDIILINKPKNMVVHPAPGHYEGTLVNGLMEHCRDELSGINGVLRPGIVHRIDKDTTGILIVCKNDMAHQCLAEQLKDHTITRRYHAIVYHNIKEESGTVDAPIARSRKERKKMAIDREAGRRAVTHYRVLERLKEGFTYIECSLETGRTHRDPGAYGIHRTSAFGRYRLWSEKALSIPLKGSVFTPKSSGLPIRGRRNTWSLRWGFLHTLKNS